MSALQELDARERLIKQQAATIDRLTAENERIEGQRKFRADLAYVMGGQRDDALAALEVERKLADDLGRLLTTAGGWLTFDTPVRVRYRISACLNAWRTTRGNQQ